jgi:hypothetical protein
LGHGEGLYRTVISDGGGWLVVQVALPSANLRARCSALPPCQTKILVIFENLAKSRKVRVDRQFDYAQKILVAVEFADAPRRLEGMPAGYALFRRLSIPDVIQAVGETQTLAGAASDGRFRTMLDRNMGYWEQHVPNGKSCFVHYAIGADAAIAAAFDRLRTEGDGFASLGVYHVEPQSSAYPYSFPSGVTPDHWHLGEPFSLTARSIFWFNFFPAQPYLFEKTFAIWAKFQMSQLKERAENNQLVASDGRERLIAQGIDEFIQVNLNRFSSLTGFFNAAREAGESTFTEDPDYIWYGMLLRKL